MPHSLVAGILPSHAPRGDRHLGSGLLPGGVAEKALCSGSSPDRHGVAQYEAGDARCRKGLQARLSAALRPPLEADALGHIRRRLDRWQIPTLPGHRVERFRQHSHIAAISTMFDKMNIARRFHT